MSVELSVVVGLLSILAIGITVLSPVFRLHARIDLLTYQVKELQKDVKALERTIYCKLPGEPNSGEM